MATEPDDIVVEAAAPANDDRVQERVLGHRSDFEAKQSTSQMPKKTPGTCRMVVEIPFEFSKEFLTLQGEAIQGRRFLDGMDLLRVVLKDWEAGDISIQDILAMSLQHSHNGVKLTVAK